VEQFA
jgi:hypothetical protein